MIIKVAPPHANVGKLVMHLGRTDDGNEDIRFLGARGVVAGDDLRGALAEMKAISRGASCQKPLYHVAFNAAPDEQLSAADWDRCLDRWEQAMGLEDRQRAVVQHHKDGRWHTHAVWNRVDPETGRAVSVGRDHFTAKRVARELERELGLQPVSDRRPAHRQDQGTPLAWEAEQARRTKTNANDARDLIRAAWEQSNTGRGFQHALDAQGLILAQGERRAFLVVDGAGNFFAVSGRVLPGERMAGIRAKLGDLDQTGLPTINQARALLEERGPAVAQQNAGRGQGAGQGGQLSPPAPESNGTPVADPKRDLHNAHRQAHLALNAQARVTDAKLTDQFNHLAAAHARERQLLEYKQRERWWHRMMRKSEKQQLAEERQRQAMARQQAREQAALEAKAKAERAAIDRQRAELRAAEKAAVKLERTPARQFAKTAEPAAVAPPPAAIPKNRPTRAPRDEVAYRQAREQMDKRERELEQRRRLQRQRGLSPGED